MAAILLLTKWRALHAFWTFAAVAQTLFPSLAERTETQTTRGESDAQQWRRLEFQQRMRLQQLRFAVW